MKFKHLMLSLGIMSKQPNAAIIAIAAVPFEPLTGEIGKKQFYKIADLFKQISFNRDVNKDIFLWWLSLPDNARNETIQVNVKTLPDILTQLNDFVALECYEPVQIWGNGCSLDNTILRNAFESYEIKPFWDQSYDRDVRTVVEIGRQIGMHPNNQPFIGIKYKMLDEAIHQAKYVSVIYSALLQRYNWNNSAQGGGNSGNVNWNNRGLVQ